MDLGKVRPGRDGSQRGRGRRAADSRAAEDGVAVVEDGGLALGHAPRRAMQPDMHRLAVQLRILARRQILVPWTALVEQES